jgi:hypothetical protein
MLTFWQITCMFRRANKLWEAVLIPFVLAGIFWSFVGKFLDGSYSVATFLDNTHFLLPLYAHISKSFNAGEFPYWINTVAGGIPIYNNPQFSLLYPFYFFGWNFYHNPLDTSLHVHYVTLFHVAVLWMSTYVMMRIFHLRVISSILGATLFAFSANTYQYLFWLNIISPYSWLPLAVGSVFLILENERPRIGLLLGWFGLSCAASHSLHLLQWIFCRVVCRHSSCRDAGIKNTFAESACTGAGQHSSIGSDLDSYRTVFTQRHGALDRCRTDHRQSENSVRRFSDWTSQTRRAGKSAVSCEYPTIYRRSIPGYPAGFPRVLRYIHSKAKLARRASSHYGTVRAAVDNWNAPRTGLHQLQDSLVEQDPGARTPSVCFCSRVLYPGGFWIRASHGVWPVS